MENSVIMAKDLTKISYRLAIEGWKKLHGKAQIFLIHEDDSVTEVDDFKQLYDHQFEGSGLFGYRLLTENSC